MKSRAANTNLWAFSIIKSSALLCYIIAGISKQYNHIKYKCFQSATAICVFLEIVAWTCTNSAPKWCPTTASQICATLRRSTAVTSPHWSKPTTPRDPWWWTCAYRSWRLEVRKYLSACVCLTHRIYITTAKKRLFFFFNQAEHPQAESRWLIISLFSRHVIDPSSERAA